MRALTFAVVAAVFAVACGDSTGPGKRAASVTAFAGDSQIAPTGGVFDFPVSFVTLDGNGQPLAGVHVAWSVSPAGAAILNPTSSVSDDNGQVSTAVTAGTVARVITISAAVTGVSSPVTFSALVMDPCLYVKGISVGQTLIGRITALDCFSDPWLYDFYAFALQVGQQSLRLTMNATVPSESLDTYVDLFGTDGSLVGFDDDVALSQITNSQLDIILPPATYIIGAHQYDPGSTGNYSVTLANRPPTMNGCREVWVVGGVSVDDSIRSSDCTEAGITSHFDVARIWINDSTTVTISERSAVLNPSLALYKLVNGPLVNGHYSRSLVTSNDDSASGNTNAFISYTVPPGTSPSGFGQPYDIIIGANGAAETGPYTLTITSVPGPSSRIPTSSRVLRSRDSWRSAGASLRPTKH